MALQGKSRYDVITQPKATIQYHRLNSAGHTLFTGEPLAAELQIAGCGAFCAIESSVRSLEG